MACFKVKRFTVFVVTKLQALNSQHLKTNYKRNFTTKYTDRWINKCCHEVMSVGNKPEQVVYAMLLLEERDLYFDVSVLFQSMVLLNIIMSKGVCYFLNTLHLQNTQ